MLKKPELFAQGYHVSYFPLGDEIRSLVEKEDFQTLDQKFDELTSKDGALFKFIQNFCEINHIETMISVRDSKNEWEEDGIWHDDGSRVFAFSLSLTLDEVQGGRLGIRHTGSDDFGLIPTPSFGGMIMFLTGIWGFEHKIHQVTQGKRVILVGWCS